jgi:hypothetical protein
MKKGIKKFFASLVFICLISISADVSAQCAMCKAAQNSSGFSSRGLNMGILYLMIIPYIAFSALAFFWYRASKKQKEQEKKVSEALKGKIGV